MTSKEQKLIFSQLVKLVIDTRNLVNLLSQGFTSDHKKNILNLAAYISNTIDKYYMNFGVCDQCGHPIPTLPNKIEEEGLENILDNYISLYELKTGNELDELFDKDPYTKLLVADTPHQPQQVINLPDSVKDKARKADKITHIKGTLIKVGK